MTHAARIRTLLLVLLAALTLCTAPAGADGGDEPRNGPKDNQAVAEAGGNGDSVIDLAFSVRETASEVVDETNTAVAYANCEACRAVAIAFQIVIVQGSPDTVTPQNVAIAVNDRCPDCSVLALSYQFVIGRGEPLEFTETGRKRLDDIRKRFAKLDKDFADLTNDEIRARTDGFADEIRDILAHDLVVARPRDEGDGDDDDENDDEQSRAPPVDRENSDDDSGGPPGATTPAQPAPGEPPPSTQTAPPEQPPTTTPTP
jgi:putative peptide zinc metalloprotease protein